MAKGVGIKELKDSLSATLDRVKAGEPVTLTDRHKPFAVIVPFGRFPVVERLRILAQAGIVQWTGDSGPIGLEEPPPVTGPGVAEAVIQDRR